MVVEYLRLVIQIWLNARTLERRRLETQSCQDQHNQTLMAMSAASSIKSCRSWTMSSRLSPPRSTSGLLLVMFCYLDIPCLTPVSHAAPGLASPDAVCGGCLGEGERPDGEPGGPNADISLCQVPTPKRSSSIVKRLQSAISGNVYIWQMVQHGFRANWPLPQVSQPELFIPGKHEIVVTHWHTSCTGRAAVFPPDKEDQSPGIVTSPVRQRTARPGPGSSSGSEDGRSSLATPSMSVSCLHHSYETLNMSDPGLGLSQPHRPAPKPPAHDDGTGECFVWF